MDVVADFDRAIPVATAPAADVSLDEIERQIDATRQSLMHQLDTLESTLAHSDTADGRELRHLATVVEHTAHLMHETVDLLQMRRAFAAAKQTVTLRISRLDFRYT